MKHQTTRPAVKRLSRYLKKEQPAGPHYPVTTTAWLMGKSRDWVYSEIRRGRLEGYRLGRRIVITLESVSGWLEIQRVTSLAMILAGLEDE